jgi:hypothetical protein
MSNSFFVKNLIPHLLNRTENAPNSSPNPRKKALPPPPLDLDQASRPEKKKRMIREWQDKIKEQQSGAGKKGNRANKSLDPAQFHSTNWKCLSAAQAATAQFTGWFPLPQQTPFKS